MAVYIYTLFELWPVDLHWTLMCWLDFCWCECVYIYIYISRDSICIGEGVCLLKNFALNLSIFLDLAIFSHWIWVHSTNKLINLYHSLLKSIYFSLKKVKRLAFHWIFKRFQDFYQLFQFSFWYDDYRWVSEGSNWSWPV